MDEIIFQEAEDHGLAVSQSGIVFASIFILQVRSPNITYRTSYINTYFFYLSDHFCTCIWEAHLQDWVDQTFHCWSISSR